VMKNVFAIGAERDGTHRHAQCVISVLDFWRGRALSRPQILGHAGACPSNC